MLLGLKRSDGDDSKRAQRAGVKSKQSRQLPALPPSQIQLSPLQALQAIISYKYIINQQPLTSTGKYLFLTVTVACWEPLLMYVFILTNNC